MPRRLLVIAVLLALLSVPAGAQFKQYTAPGTLGLETEPTDELARKDASEARWKLGRLRLNPRFSLTGAGYYENVFSAPDDTEPADDFRATASAGLTAHINFGPKSLVSATVAPQYSWWRDRNELSELSVNYGAGWFGSFNRLQLGASTERYESERPLSDELEAPVRIETESSGLRADLSVTDFLTLVAGASVAEVRNSANVDSLVPGLDATSLDRDNERASAALALDIRRWRVALGFENTQVDFVVDPQGRSNSGEGPTAQVTYKGDRITLDLRNTDRRLDFENPALGRRTESVGTGTLSYRPSERTRFTAYADRSLGFAVFDQEGFLLSERFGVSLSNDLGRRFKLNVFAETGNAAFSGPSSEGRRDDLEAFGAVFEFAFSKNLALSLRASETAWDSNFPGFDRSQSSFGLGLSLAQGRLRFEAR